MERNPTLRALDRIVEYLDTALDQYDAGDEHEGKENVRLARADACAEAKMLRFAERAA